MDSTPVDISGLELKIYGGAGGSDNAIANETNVPYFDIKITPSYVTGTFTRDIVRMLGFVC